MIVQFLLNKNLLRKLYYEGQIIEIVDDPAHEDYNRELHEYFIQKCREGIECCEISRDAYNANYADFPDPFQNPEDEDMPAAPVNFESAPPVETATAKAVAERSVAPSATSKNSSKAKTASKQSKPSEKPGEATV